MNDTDTREKEVIIQLLDDASEEEIAVIYEFVSAYLR